MAGHYGDAKRTTQNLEIVGIDIERNLLLIKGAVPASKGGSVIVRPSTKITKNIKQEAKKEEAPKKETASKKETAPKKEEAD